jgi:hypothetical protein
VVIMYKLKGRIVPLDTGMVFGLSTFQHSLFLFLVFMSNH